MTAIAVCGHAGPCDLGQRRCQRRANGHGRGGVGRQRRQYRNQVPTLNTVHSPGTAPAAITVGASTNSHVFYQAVKVRGPNVPSGLQQISALFGDGPKMRRRSMRRSRTSVQPATTAWRAPGCPGARSPAPSRSSSGASAPSPTRSISRRRPAPSGSSCISPADRMRLQHAVCPDTGIPAVMIGNTDGKALKIYLASNPALRLSLDPTLTASDTPPR